METENKTLAILNLSGELSPELAAYFDAHKMRVVDPLTEDVTLEWTHVLTKDLHDFTLIELTYETVAKDVRIISLSAVNDLQNFVLSNGKLIFDELWLKGDIGTFILDKFFQEYGGVSSIDENYPRFQEQGSFKVINPFNTGDYLDRMVYHAFQHGTTGLSVKTFFDHLLMYLSGLKAKGKVGLPIEVTYGNFEDIFGVQLHFFTQGLDLSDVSSCLSSSITKRPEEYLLNISVQSSDFFDFTFISEVNKVVITGLWTKDDRIKAENRGLLFTQVTSAAALTEYPSEGAQSHLIDLDESSPDLSEMVHVGDQGEDTDGDEVSKITGTAPEEELITKLAGTAPEEELVTKLAGTAPEEELVTKLAGTAPEEELITKLAGTAPEEELITKLRGTGPEEELITRIKGTKEDLHNTVTRISGTKGEKPEDMKVKSIGAMPVTEKGDFKVRSLGANDFVTDKGDMTVKSLFKTPNPGAPDPLLIQKLSILEEENAKLKKQLQSVASELKATKVSNSTLALIQEKAEAMAKAAAEAEPETDATKAELKKLRIEATQKEVLFKQELLKAERTLAAKDLLVTKTKESFTKLIEKKDIEFDQMRSKVEQVNKALASANGQVQNQQLRDLEKTNANLLKMNDMYKDKIGKLVAAMEAAKNDDKSKEESKLIQITNIQMQNKLDQAKRDLAKLKDRINKDSALINDLRKQNTANEALLKNRILDTSKTKEEHVAVHVANQDLKKIQTLNSVLETQIKDLSSKLRNSEQKILELSKAKMSASPTGPDETAKTRITHLETNLKKLTQDLMTAQAQSGEVKKETMKLRQEKVALQNLVDKLKKDLEKYEKKTAAPKGPAPVTPGGPGSAASPTAKSPATPTVPASKDDKENKGGKAA